MLSVLAALVTAATYLAQSFQAADRLTALFFLAQSWLPPTITFEQFLVVLTVVSLLVSVGDQVRQDQTVLELENQKAVAPIPAPAAGTVTQIHVKQGDVVSVGQLLVTLSEEVASAQDTGAAPQPALSKQQPKGSPAAQSSVSPAVARPASGFPPPASPSIRKMAMELGVDLARVSGSGSGGRITPEDVRAYLQVLQSGSAAAKGSAPAPPQVDFSQWGPVQRQPFTPLRQAIARAMVESWTTIPHVTQFDEANVAGIQGLIRKFGPEYEKKGTRLTLTGIVIRALLPVLKKHPIFNSSLDESAQELVLKQYFHIGIAVDTQAGLIVPVLKDADRKKMPELARALQDLAEKTRARKISAQDLQGGTFTISNQGGIGGGHFTPIIHKPEVAILGLGRAKEGGNGMLPLSLSYDHRVIDGADAARFIRDLVQGFENFPEAEVVG